MHISIPPIPVEYYPPLPYHVRSFCGETFLRLSKRTEYGLRAVVQLARLEPRAFVQSKDLAQQEKLPNKFLESILLAVGSSKARSAAVVGIGCRARRVKSRWGN